MIRNTEGKASFYTLLTESMPLFRPKHVCGSDLPLHLALALALHGLEQGFQPLHLHVAVVQLPPQVVDGDAVARVSVPQALVLLLLQTQLLLSLVQISLKEARNTLCP